MPATSEPKAKPKIWWEKERINGEIVDCLTVILRTRGCSWNACNMCSYTSFAYPADEEELRAQLRYALSENAEVVKIFTSGSFFDDREVPRGVRLEVAERVRDMGAKKLIVESRPEFITEDVLDDFRGVNLEVGIGLESADDFVRNVCINKGFNFEDFEQAAKILKNRGFRVKCYLLLKPPFLSEREAIDDVLSSVERVRDLANVISVNPTNVQKGTLVEKLWYAGFYRPPWLWSAVEVLKRAENVDIICDPVAAGKRRGAHNCGKCDGAVAKAIREFSLTQDKSKLSVECSCKTRWKKALELESYSRIPLFS